MPNKLQKEKPLLPFLAKKPNKNDLGRQEILEAERIFQEGIASVIDIVAPSAMRVTPNFVQVGEQFTSTLFVFVYPRFLQSGWLAPVINMSVPFNISLFIYPLASEVIMKNLKAKSSQVESQLHINQEKGMVRDPMLETALQDIEQLRDQLQQGTERFFKFSVYITLFGNTEKEMRKTVETIEGLMNSRLIYTKRATLQMEQGFNSTLPLGNDELSITNNMNTAPLSTTFPFVSSELSQNNGILYGVNRHNNSLILFDRFTLENANSVIFAKSGGGKSYTTKLEILRYMMSGTDVIVIDPENEYQHLAEATGGAYLKISLNSPSRINPFDLPRNSEEPVADILRGAVIQLKAMIGLMVGKLDPTEDSLLDNALIETYAKKDITESTQNLDTVEFPTMSDLADILSNVTGGESLSQRIAKYTTGTFSGLLDAATNIDLTKQLVVFSIRDLEDELRPIAMFLTLTYIWNMTRSSLKKRLLFIDEAWWMMQYEDSAKFLYGLAKRARKYYLGVTIISQDVADFLASDYGRAVVNNASLYILLKQSPASIDVITQTFSLTRYERQLLLQSSVGQGIFFAGQRHVAIQVTASPREDQIITSDPRQLLAIQDAKREFAESLQADEKKVAEAGDVGEEEPALDANDPTQSLDETSDSDQ